MPVEEAIQDRAEWLDWRRAGIGASDIAKAATGLYGGSWGVVHSKLHGSEEITNTAIERGNRWELAITSAAEQLLGVAVVGEQMRATATGNPLHRATIDGLLLPVDAELTIANVIGVLEVKTFGLHVKPAIDYWLAQVQWQMYCTGLDFAVVASACVDDSTDTVQSMRLARVERNEFEIDRLLALAAEIERHIEAGTYPDPPASALDEVKDLSIAAYDGGAETADLSSIAADVDRLAEIKEALKAVEAERDALQAKVIQAMGAATKGVCGDVLVSLTKPRSVLTKDGEAQLLAARPEFAVTALDRARAKAEAKDLYSQLCEPVGARTLTLKRRTQ